MTRPTTAPIAPARSGLGWTGSSGTAALSCRAGGGTPVPAVSAEIFSILFAVASI